MCGGYCKCALMMLLSNQITWIQPCATSAVTESAAPQKRGHSVFDIPCGRLSFVELKFRPRQMLKKKQCWHQQLILSQCVHCADAIHTYCLSKHPSALAQTRALFCLVMKRDFQFTFARDGSSRLLSNVRQTHINLSSPKVTETRYRD